MNSYAAALYEKNLLEQTSNLALKTKGDSEIDEQNTAKDLFRYAFEVLLRWSPADVRDYLNIDVIKWLKLTYAYTVIPFPPELSKDTDAFYLAAILYPDEIKFSKRNLVLTQYDRLLSGEIKRLPKAFFDAANGRENLSICFQHAVNCFIGDISIKELYDYFSVPRPEFSKKSKLKTSLQEFGNMHDLIYFIYGEHEESGLWYRYYKFQNELKKARKDDDEG